MYKDYSQFFMASKRNRYSGENSTEADKRRMDAHRKIEQRREEELERLYNLEMY